MKPETNVTGQSEKVATCHLFIYTKYYTPLCVNDVCESRVPCYWWLFYLI